MKITIPAKLEIMCDICKHVNTSFRRGAFMKIESTGFDCWGNSADSGCEYDLCDSCLNKIENYIKNISLDELETK